MDEKELLRAATSNADAFVELYRLHVTRVYRYHMAHVSNAKEAEDLTTQTFAAALEEFSTFHKNDSFIAWLMGIASKKRRNDAHGNRRELPDDAVLYYQNSGLPTDKAAMQRQDLETTTRALKQISPEHAEAIILTFFSDLSISEVGRVLKKSTDATPKLILQGIQELRIGSTSNLDEQETTDANPEDELLADKLTHLAFHIAPDPHFIDELEKTLLANHQPKTKWTFSWPQLAPVAGWALLIAVGAFLLYWRVTPGATVPPFIPNTGNITSTAIPEAASTKATAGPLPTVRATTTRFPTLEYVVQAGDTCTYIAEQFGVTIDQLITLNDLNETCDILIDQEILIPILPTSTP